MAFKSSAEWRNYAEIVGSLDGSAIEKGAVTCERRAAEDNDGDDPKSTF